MLSLVDLFLNSLWPHFSQQPRLEQPLYLIENAFLWIAVAFVVALVPFTILTLRWGMILSRKRGWLNGLSSAYAGIGVFVFLDAWVLYFKGPVFGLPVSEAGMVVFNVWAALFIVVALMLRREAASLDLDLSSARFKKGRHDVR